MNLSLRTAFNVVGVGVSGALTGAALYSHKPEWVALGALLTVSNVIFAGFSGSASFSRDAVSGAKTEPEIRRRPTGFAGRVGDVDDGGVYVGLSVSSGEPPDAALADPLDCKTYAEALDAADELKSVHPTAHVPTPKELDQNLFDNRNTGHLGGTFNTSGSYPDGVYRTSSSCSTFNARVQWFDDGVQDVDRKYGRGAVRLVW